MQKNKLMVQHEEFYNDDTTSTAFH